MAPSPTVTRLGTVCPATKFRLDASGIVTLCGNTIRKPGAVVSVAVTLRTTALTPVAGTPPFPSIWTLIVPPEASFELKRVSRMRAGVSG